MSTCYVSLASSISLTAFVFDPIGSISFQWKQLRARDILQLLTFLSTLGYIAGFLVHYLTFSYWVTKVELLCVMLVHDSSRLFRRSTQQPLPATPCPHFAFSRQAKGWVPRQAPAQCTLVRHPINHTSAVSHLLPDAGRPSVLSHLLRDLRAFVQ